MPLEQAVSVVTAFGSLATAIAVVVAIWHLKLSVDQAHTAFEDTLEREYRAIISQIPVKVFIDARLTSVEYAKALPALYRYIDLSNAQVFLRQHKRIRLKTWAFWCDGIKSNLARSPFQKAWHHIKSTAQPSFSELRRLEASGFKDDPATWH